MSAIPSFTEQDILARAGERSFQRGQRALREGAVRDARRQGACLKAVCAGTQPEPYRVRVEFAEQGIAGAYCSCPVGHGGDCKHVAALLLCWLERPASFAQLEPLEDALARQTKDQLIVLLRQMLRQQPELESLLERPLHAQERVPVDPETYRREAAALFARGRRDWGAEAGIAERLEALAEIGADLGRRGDHAGAAAVYQGVAVASVDGFESVYDEDRRIAGLVRHCVQALAATLQAAAGDPEGREAALQALYWIYRAAVGIDLGFAETYAREALGDPDLLRLCRANAWVYGLVRRLVELGRIPEATEHAGDVGDADELDLADLCLRHAEQPGALDLASKLYRQHVEFWIGMRGRENYREARQLLERMRPLEERLGGPERWAAYLASLRERHRTLRALIEEMDAAGLGGS